MLVPKELQHARDAWRDLQTSWWGHGKAGKQRSCAPPGAGVACCPPDLALPPPEGLLWLSQRFSVQAAPVSIDGSSHMNQAI